MKRWGFLITRLVCVIGLLLGSYMFIFAMRGLLWAGLSLASAFALGTTLSRKN